MSDETYSNKRAYKIAVQLLASFEIAPMKHELCFRRNSRYFVNLTMPPKIRQAYAFYFLVASIKPPSGITFLEYGKFHEKNLLAFSTIHIHLKIVTGFAGANFEHIAFLIFEN